MSHYRAAPKAWFGRAGNTEQKAQPIVINRAKKPTPFLYILRNPLTGHYKVGVAESVVYRCTTLTRACGAALEVVASVASGAPMERAVHKRLAASRTIGEWFLPTPEIASLIEMLSRTQSTDVVQAWLDA